MLRHRRLLPAAFAVFSMSTSCGGGRQVQWGEETVTAPTTPAPAPATPAHVDAAAYAQRFPTDGACETEARRIAVATPPLATRLITACITRGDFKRIGGLTAAPWTSTLASAPSAPSMCGRVVAARAGDVEADVKACARAGFGTKTLHEAYSSPGSAKGMLVIFRARPDIEHDGGKRVVRLIETVFADGEVETEPTGRRISATFGARQVPAGDAIYLGRVQRVGVDPVAKDGDALVSLEVIELWSPAMTPTFGS